MTAVTQVFKLLPPDNEELCKTQSQLVGAFWQSSDFFRDLPESPDKLRLMLDCFLFIVNRVSKG